jgi:transposase
MARIVGHLPVEELEARYRAAQDATAARHYQAIWLLARGHTVLEVSEVLAFVPRWVTQLAARYNASGPAALGDQRRRNGKAASLLTPDLLAALAERLKRPPEDGGVWSGPEVAGWMARHLRVQKVHPQRGWEALKRIGWSIQAPRPRGMRARPRPSSGRPSKGARGGGRAGQGGAPGPPGRGLGGGRAPARPEADPPPGLGAHRPAAGRPRPPPLSMAARHRLRAAEQRRGGLVSCKRPLASILQAASRKRKRPLASGLSKPFFEALLAAFARQTGAGRQRHIVLVLDNARWHGPEGLVVPDGISPVFLPPYSPELQPAEQLWPLVDEPVANRHFATLADLEAVIAERCRRLDAAAIRPHTDFHRWPKPIRTN